MANNFLKFLDAFLNLKTGEMCASYSWLYIDIEKSRRVSDLVTFVCLATDF